MVFFTISSITKSINNTFNNIDLNRTITKNYKLPISSQNTFNSKSIDIKSIKSTDDFLPKLRITNKLSFAVVVYLTLLFTCSNVAHSQDAIVNDYLTMVARGKVQEVKAKLPDLMVEYPDSPAVKLLLAVVLEDATKSVEIYKDIVKKYPDNIWADDAYWRLIQYYAIVGDINKAKSELAIFRENYPTSPFLVTSGETVRLAESVISSRNSKNMSNSNNVVNPNSANNSSEITEIKVYKEPKTSEPKEENHSEANHSTAKTETSDKKLTNKLEKQKTPLPTLEELSNETEENEAKDNEIAELREEHSEEMEVEVNLEHKENPMLHSESNSHKTNEHSEPAKNIEKNEKIDKNSKSKNEEMSLEDEMKMRQNISKSLANNKLESEVKTENAINNAKSDKENNANKNILNEEENVTSLMKTEEELKSKTYGLQVAVYNSKDAAELEMQKYIKQRMRTEVKTKSVDGNKLYAVVIGNYSSKESAEGARTIVEKQCNCEPMIFEK